MHIYLKLKINRNRFGMCFRWKFREVNLFINFQWFVCGSEIGRALTGEFPMNMWYILMINYYKNAYESKQLINKVNEHRIRQKVQRKKTYSEPPGRFDNTILFFVYNQNWFDLFKSLFISNCFCLKEKQSRLKSFDLSNGTEDRSVRMAPQI